MLDTLELDSGQNPTASVIWLHGLGADGNDFAPIVRELDLPATAIRFVFPHAPTMPVTINGGYVMRAWYDILGTELDRREDEVGVRASQTGIEALLAREIDRGVAPIASCSPDSPKAVPSRCRPPCASPAVWPASWPCRPMSPSPAFGGRAHRCRASVPIFMAHGTHDGVIPLATAQRARALLDSLGYAVEWHEYAMEHSVCIEEIADIGAFLRRVLSVNQLPERCSTRYSAMSKSWPASMRRLGTSR